MHIFCLHAHNPLQQREVLSLPLLQQALIARCRCLSAISLLDAPHLSDVAFEAIAEVAKLKTFSTEGEIILHSATLISTYTWKKDRSNSIPVMCTLGNNQLTDVSWKALCSSSQGLRRLHAAECPRMTDTSLKSVATLKNLHYLDISLCNKCVCLLL